jgi:MerR family transcriptional regulator, light-induced transcriptional regulator
MDRSQQADIDLPRVLERYIEAQLRGNLRGALRLLDEALERGSSVTALQCHVIQAAQRQVGCLWRDNRISVAQEHLASAISQVALARLFTHAQPLPALGTSVAVACVEGELHELPARLVSDYLELAGFTVVFLGANLPTDSLVSLLEQEPMDVLALSVTMVFNLPALRSAVSAVREHLGSNLPILVGGHAIEEAPGIVDELRVRSAGLTPAELASAVLRTVAERVH